MQRRDFMSQMATGAAAALLPISALAYTQKHRATPAPTLNSKLQRIAVSTWSLKDYFPSTRPKDSATADSTVVLLDFPEIIAQRYKVHHLEFSSVHFPSVEPTYLRELRYALVHTSSTVVNLLVDIDECGPEGTFSDPDEATRLAAVEAVKGWVDVAHSLAARSVRVGPGKVDFDSLQRTANSYKAVALYAQPRGMRVIIENHPGFAFEVPEQMMDLLKLAGLAHLGTLPDLADFTDETTREKGLRLLFPYAPTVCHVNGPANPTSGGEDRYDLSLAMAIAKKTAFRGVFSIEFVGSHDPYAEIQKTLDELLVYL